MTGPAPFYHDKLDPTWLRRALILENPTFPALMMTLQSLRVFLASRWRPLGPGTRRPKVVWLNRDEIPDHLLRDLGIYDGDRSDHRTFHEAVVVRPVRSQIRSRREKAAGSSCCAHAAGR